jgi:thymidine kinase
MNNSLIPEMSTVIEGNETGMSGYLELIIGPMYSGKTSKLLELYKQFTFCGIKTMVINYHEDTRYSATHLSTHDKIMIPCRQARTLNVDITTHNKEFTDAQVILINEGQFFEDIVNWTKCAVETHKKTVYICGLDGDFKRQKFGSWLDLIPLCDKVSKLHSYCSQCKKKPAIFSHRLSSEKEQVLIGSDCYVPLCRACYLAALSCL